MKINTIEEIEHKLKLSNGLEVVEKEIKKLFTEIGQAQSIADSEEKFKELANFQFVLAKAVFKEGLSVPAFLRQFIYDFDRIDDVLVKKKEFEKIKSGYYNI
ncbi:MAG: hypothetical protein ACJ748_04685 [Flavisolibacter sp.]